MALLVGTQREAAPLVAVPDVAHTLCTALAYSMRRYLFVCIACCMSTLHAPSNLGADSLCRCNKRWSLCHAWFTNKDVESVHGACFLSLADKHYDTLTLLPLHSYSYYFFQVISFLLEEILYFPLFRAVQIPLENKYVSLSIFRLMSETGSKIQDDS